MTPYEIERRNPPKSPIFAFQSIKAYIFPLPKPDHKPSIEKSFGIFSPSDGKKVTVLLSGASCAINLLKTNEDVGRNDLELGSFINDTPARLTNDLREDNRPHTAIRKKGTTRNLSLRAPRESRLLDTGDLGTGVSGFSKMKFLPKEGVCKRPVTNGQVFRNNSYIYKLFISG